MRIAFLKSIVLFALVGVFSSCSEDLEDLVTPPEVEGVWELQSHSYTIKSTVMKDGETITLSNSGMATDNTLQLTIMKDPDEFLAEGFYLIEAPADLEGTTMKPIFPFENVHKRGTWIMDNEKFIFDYVGIPPIEADIINFSDTQLKVSFTLTVPGDVDGHTSQNTVDGVYTFIKK